MRTLSLSRQETKENLLVTLLLLANEKDERRNRQNNTGFGVAKVKMGTGLFFRPKRNGERLVEGITALQRDVDRVINTKLKGDGKHGACCILEKQGNIKANDHEY
jgi:hypothetical protein